MAQKIYFPTTLWEIKQDTYTRTRYHIGFKQDQNKIINSLITNNNAEVIFNFEEKKDRRKPETKILHPLYFPLHNMFPHSYPEASLALTAPKFCKSSFDLYLYHSNKPLSNLTNTLTTNLTLHKCNISNPPFKHLVFNQLNTSAWVEENRYTEFDFSTNQYDITDDILINDFKNPVHIRDLNCQQLKKLTIKGTNKIKLSPSKIKAPHLETLDLKDVKTIFLETESYELDALKYKSDDIFDRYRSSNKFSNFLVDLKDNINPNADIILNPETTISASMGILPPNIMSTANRTYNDYWKISDIFPESINTKEFHIKPVELMYGIWKFTNNKIINYLTDQDKVFSESIKNAKQKWNEPKQTKQDKLIK